MPYKLEKDMYPAVAKWLTSYLQHKYPKAKVNSYDTSQENLSDFIRRKKLNKYFPEAETYVIKVDITGVVEEEGKCVFGFVECKKTPISLKDISQLIGYSKVFIPCFSIILSPKGISTPINKLINIYRRYDVLTYRDRQMVRIATWNKESGDIETASLLPHGYHL